MPEEAEAELQKEIRAALVGDVPVMELAGGVYDRVPKNPFKGKKSYVSFGATEIRPDDADCINGVGFSITLNVWSKAVGQVECKRLAARIRKRLHRAELVMTDNALVQLELDVQRNRSLPDGLTSQAILTFSGQIEEPA